MNHAIALLLLKQELLVINSLNILMGRRHATYDLLCLLLYALAFFGVDVGSGTPFEKNFVRLCRAGLGGGGGGGGGEGHEVCLDEGDFGMDYHTGR